jgi:hypothetical protein
VGDDDLIFSGQPGYLAHGQFQIRELLGCRSFLPLFDEGVAAEGDQDDGFFVHGDYQPVHDLRFAD